MSDIPNCPECNSPYGYLDGKNFVCPECGHEWQEDTEADASIVDSNGKLLQDGDTVTVIKDLKVKGSSSVVKVGTKVKNIRLSPNNSSDDHNIDCKIDGIGAIKLTSKFVKKV